MSLTENDSQYLVLGDGENEVDATGSLLNVTAGAGFNTIDLSSTLFAVVNAGDGGNSIAVDATLTLVAAKWGPSRPVSPVRPTSVGDGNDTIEVRGGSINVASGGGNDTVTVLGLRRGLRVHDSVLLHRRVSP